MKLHKIIAELETLSINGGTDQEISGIAYDSRQVKPGTIFVAVRGAGADGHELNRIFPCA